jgi:hypothetical protein
MFWWNLMSVLWNLVNKFVKSISCFGENKWFFWYFMWLGLSVNGFFVFQCMFEGMAKSMSHNTCQNWYERDTTIWIYYFSQCTTLDRKSPQANCKMSPP